MRHTTKHLILSLLSFFLTLKVQIYGHGFGPNTYVKICDTFQYYDYSNEKYVNQTIEGWRSIEQIYEHPIDDTLKVKSYDSKSFTNSYQLIKVAGKCKTNCFIKISFNLDSSGNNFIECSPNQKFFVVETQKWEPAYLLQKGDVLFCDNYSGKEITKIEFIKSPYQFYMLEIDNMHTFCIGNDSILTHNIPLPVGFLLTLGISFGEGAVAGGSAGSFLGPVTIGTGIVVGGIIGITVACISTDRKKAEYRIKFDADGFEEYIKANSTLSNFSEKNEKDSKDKQKQKDAEREKSGAQAPGIPTKEDGFVPPKNWNGEKTRHPKTGQIGYPDKSGKIWVPTGHGPKAHGGPHWDVQYPNGIDYDNVYPR